MLNKYYKEESESKLLSQQNNFHIKQSEIMNEAYDNIMFLRHDMKNHLLSLKAISDDSAKINAYIDEYINLDVEIEYAKSGNIVIDSVLNYKLYEAYKRDIGFSLDLKVLLRPI